MQTLQTVNCASSRLQRMEVAFSMKEMVSAYDYYASSLKLSKFETLNIFYALEAFKGPVVVNNNFYEFFENSKLKPDDLKQIEEKARKLSASERKQLDWYPADANVIDWEFFCNILSISKKVLKSTDLMLALIEYKSYKISFLERRRVSADAYELLEFRRLNTERNLNETKERLEQTEAEKVFVEERLEQTEAEKVFVEDKLEQTEAEKVFVEEKLEQTEAKLEETEEFVERVIPRHVPRNRVNFDRREQLCILYERGNDLYKVIRGQASYVQKQIRMLDIVVYRNSCPNPREAWTVLKREGENRRLFRSNVNKFRLLNGVNINQVLGLFEELEQQRAQ